MANVRFGNIDRTPETTGKSVWGWHTEPGVQRLHTATILRRLHEKI